MCASHVARWTVVGLTIASLCGPAAGQSSAERIAWLRQNAIAIRPGDSPASQPATSASSGDVADLLPIKDMLAGVRVVVLGEPSHGDGAALRAKARLAEFLHAELGFDVLIWETGLFDGRTMDTLLRAGVPPSEAFAAGLPDFWSDTCEVEPLLEHVAASYRTERPFEVAGFGIAYEATCTTLFDDLLAFCDQADANLLSAADREGLAELRDYLKERGSRPRPSTPREPPELPAALRVLDRLKSDGPLARVHSAAEIEFMRRAVENLVFFTRALNRPLPRNGMEGNPQAEQEGRNLLYLVRQRYPKRKLVVWAHSCHLIRNCAGIEELGRNYGTSSCVSAGDYVCRALGREVYSIMFLSGGGREGIWWETPRDMAPPPEGSLEDLLHCAGCRAAFLDLRSPPADHWMREPLVARPLAFEPLRACWDRCADGVFFNDRTGPSERRGTP